MCRLDAQSSRYKHRVIPIEEEAGWAPQKFWALLWGRKIVFHMLRIEPEFFCRPALNTVIKQIKL